MKRLYLGNLSYQTTADSIKAFLESVGGENSVSKVEMIPGLDGKPNKGFSFAVVEDDAAAEKMIAELNEQSLDGRNVRVNEARPKTDNPRPFRSDRGDYNRRPNYNNNRDDYYQKAA